MRILHNDAIFSYQASTDTYSNNTTSKMLLSDHWTQWHNWVDLYGNEFYDMARGIPASCRKDATRTPAQINFDTDIDMFKYFTEQGWLPRLHKTLGGGAIAQAPGILEDYPWEEIADATFLDVGGGGGALVALVLRKHKSMQAGILDLPKVIDHATSNFHSPDGQYADVGDRVPKDLLVAGDFLAEVPSSEVYTMKWCLHDWDDSKSLKILGNIRKVIKRGPSSRLIVFESLLEDGRIGRLSRYADLTMMVSANGQERNESEWNSLAEQTGWRVNRVYHLRNAWPCAIEMVPVWKPECEGNGGENTNTYELAQDGARNLKEAVSANLKLNGVATTNGSTQCLTTKGMLYNGDCKGHENAQGIQVSSVMSFLEPWDPSRGNPFYRSAADKGFENTNFKWTDHDVTIADARPHKDKFTLDRNGFAYLDDSEGLTSDLIEALRKGEKETVKSMYYPRVEALVRKHTGASRIIIFDHTLRKRDPCKDKAENQNGKEQPATVVRIPCNSTEIPEIDHSIGSLRSASQVLLHTLPGLMLARSAKGAIERIKQNLDKHEKIDEILRGRAQIIK